MRCVEHNLATGPDGLCVVCRRERGLSSRPPVAAVAAPPATSAPRISRMVGSVLALAALALGAAFAADRWVDLNATLPASATAAIEPDNPTPPPNPREAARPKPTPKPAPKPRPRPAEPPGARPARPAEPDVSAQALLAGELDPSALSRPRQERTPRTHKRATQGSSALKAIEAREAERRQRRAQRERGDVEIVMYATSWCGYCKRARAYFAERGIRYRHHDIEQDAEAKAEHALLSPRGGVPTFTIDGRLMQGFSAAGMDAALDRAARARARR